MMLCLFSIVVYGNANREYRINFIDALFKSLRTAQKTKFDRYSKSKTNQRNTD